MVSPYFILHLCKIQVINWNVYSLNVSIRGKNLTVWCDFVLKFSLVLHYIRGLDYLNKIIPLAMNK